MLMLLTRRLAGLALLAIAAETQAAADSPLGTDVPGAADHPLISRFSGAWLVGYQQREFDQARWPAAPALQKNNSDQFKELASQEGRITRLVYINPKGKTSLEVYRNHEQAFAAAGFKPLWSCERDCEKTYWAWRHQLDFMAGLQWANGYLTTASGSRYSVNSPVAAEESRLWVGQLKRSDGSMVMLQFITGVASNRLTESAASWLQIVEPQAMQTNQVTINEKALLAGLEAEGKVALYGLFFDTGRAEIKPESRPQLEEMAKLLQSQPTLKVFIVGHTDNVGSFEANQALSLKRADAVAAALAAAPYKIDARRLQAKGAANIAPLASNATEPGRARNRRVELVQQ